MSALEVGEAIGVAFLLLAQWVVFPVAPLVLKFFRSFPLRSMLDE